MTKKFKVGDRIGSKYHDDENFFQKGEIGIITNVAPYLNNINKIIDRICVDRLNGYPMWFISEDFELVERKIGDKWFKSEELNEDGTPIDLEDTVHFCTKSFYFVFPRYVLDTARQ